MFLEDGSYASLSMSPTWLRHVLFMLKTWFILHPFRT